MALTADTQSGVFFKKLSLENIKHWNEELFS